VGVLQFVVPLLRWNFCSSQSIFDTTFDFNSTFLDLELGMTSALEFKSIVWTLGVLLLISTVLNWSELNESFGACDEHFVKALGSDIMLRNIGINATNHLYPYVATVFTCGCILVIIIGIILFGGQLD
jgi:hypothetical protein